MKELKNFTEEAISRFVEKELPNTDTCQCESCRLDIMAIMLNDFKAHYVVSKKGALYAQMDEEFDLQRRIDFMSSMAKAVQIVRDKPRH